VACNAYVPSSSAEQRQLVLNPATGEAWAEVDWATAEAVTNAVDLAARAQVPWRRLPAIERASAMRRWALALEAATDEIAEALAQESGKSLADARAEVGYGIEILRYHAEWARRIEGEIIASDSASEQLLLYREPMGVVACLIPFNFPIYTLLRKVAPALITGNTVVVRPSNTTPCSALVLARTLLSAQLPAGVVNILAMDHSVGEVLCTRPPVAMITLTGSVRAGRQMLNFAQTHIAKTSLELGGKTPAIVAPDADLDQAARDIVRSRLTHCGQLCTAVERVIAHRSVYAALLEKIATRMQVQTFGDRAADAQRMGPLATAQARDNIHAMVMRAQAQGARLVLGGEVPAGPGFFYPPTLLAECTPSMEVVQEEVFGPVLAVMACDSMDEALAWANDHQYGLSSVLYTEDHRLVQHFSREIEAGELYVNRTPADPYQGFHAGWKRSGLGGDDGKHGMLEFTQTRLVVLPY
jgi:lactaldehyde dehydrogenase/glycolaldehyde dehydrogenase